MLQYISVLGLFLAVMAEEPIFHGSTCPYPNGTDVSIHMFGCDGNFKTFIRSAKVLTSDGKENYPIDFRKPIVVVLDAQNDAEVFYANTISITIWKYSSNWFNPTCHWSEIPTFGLLKKLDGCKFAHNCPIQKGKLTMRLPLDFTELSGVIGMLTGNSAYQVEIQMFNANPGTNGDEEIACVVTQMRIAQSPNAYSTSEKHLLRC